MAQKTALSVLALPGRVLSFLAKGVFGPHNPGKITQLSTSALPSKVLSFLAKGVFGPHNPGQVTELSVNALPGRVHTFKAFRKGSRGRHIGRLFKGIIGA